MKEILVQKLTSRKLWVAVVGVVVGLAATFGIEENDYAQIVGLIGSIVSAITYIFAEASVDKVATTPTAEQDVVDDALEEALHNIEGTVDNG